MILHDTLGLKINDTEEHKRKVVKDFVNFWEVIEDIKEFRKWISTEKDKKKVEHYSAIIAYIKQKFNIRDDEI